MLWQHCEELTCCNKTPSIIKITQHNGETLWTVTVDITSEGWCKKERVAILALAFATLSCILHSSQLFLKEINLFCYTCMCSGIVYITFSSHSTYSLIKLILLHVWLSVSLLPFSNIQRIYDVVKFSYTQLIYELRGALCLWIGDRSLAVVCVCDLNCSTVYLAFLRSTEGALDSILTENSIVLPGDFSAQVGNNGNSLYDFFPSLDFCASHSSSITNTMYTISMSISAHGLKALTLGSRVKTGGELSTN